jgi:hypothetical protein
MAQHCQSCAAPLADPAFKGNSDRYCSYCVDRSGKLISREQALQNVVGWFKMWQPACGDAELKKRAELYLKSMPAWAEQ